jgi:hypothetical protein
LVKRGQVVKKVRQSFNLAHNSVRDTRSREDPEAGAVRAANGEDVHVRESPPNPTSGQVLELEHLEYIGNIVERRIQEVWGQVWCERLHKARSIGIAQTNPQHGRQSRLLTQPKIQIVPGHRIES